MKNIKSQITTFETSYTKVDYTHLILYLSKMVWVHNADGYLDISLTVILILSNHVDPITDEFFFLTY
jgi:hypothetical protein